MFNFLSRTRKKRDRLNQEISLSTPTNFGELQDIIPDTRRFENEVINKIIVHEALDRLKNTKYKQFIIEYYGIDVPQLNIRELALKYGVSKQSVQQTIKWGLEVLRKEIK
jgi:DNA-directed RNA polymerase specialized sigma subunit